ncbi:hypothetical protein FQR65_LT08783 [Abscondita terminalis]|nr:hypothetical protein FQR65_LT08783 [Abscondita terminalis]
MFKSRLVAIFFTLSILYVPSIAYLLPDDRIKDVFENDLVNTDHGATAKFNDLDLSVPNSNTTFQRKKVIVPNSICPEGEQMVRSGKCRKVIT